MQHTYCKILLVFCLQQPTAIDRGTRAPHPTQSNRPKATTAATSKTIPSRSNQPRNDTQYQELTIQTPRTISTLCLPHQQHSRHDTHIMQAIEQRKFHQLAAEIRNPQLQQGSWFKDSKIAGIETVRELRPEIECQVRRLQWTGLSMLSDEVRIYKEVKRDGRWVGAAMERPQQ